MKAFLLLTTLLLASSLNAKGLEVSFETTDGITVYGDSMNGCRPESFSETVTQPLLALRPEREMEIAYVSEQIALFTKHGHQTYVAAPGVHGSSMLNSARVGESTEKTWGVVLEFLDTTFAE